MKTTGTWACVCVDARIWTDINAVWRHLRHCHGFHLSTVKGVRFQKSSILKLFSKGQVFVSVFDRFGVDDRRKRILVWTGPQCYAVNEKTSKQSVQIRRHLFDWTADWGSYEKRCSDRQFFSLADLVTCFIRRQIHWKYSSSTHSYAHSLDSLKSFNVALLVCNEPLLSVMCWSRNTLFSILIPSGRPAVVFSRFTVFSLLLVSIELQMKIKSSLKRRYEFPCKFMIHKLVSHKKRGGGEGAPLSRGRNGTYSIKKGKGEWLYWQVASQAGFRRTRKTGTKQ